VDVPIEQQVEYTQLLEQLHRQCVEMEHRLVIVAIILKDVDESLLKRVVTIVSFLFHFPVGDAETVDITARGMY
jgi:hypothetical protein